MRKLATVALVVLALGTASVAVADDVADRHPTDHPVVVPLAGQPTTFVSLDAGGFPTLVGTVEARTTEGRVTITETIGSFFDDIVFGATPGGTNAEHIVLTEVWDFGGGDTITTDGRVFIAPILATDGCTELIPNDIWAVVTGGTGRFAGASGFIQMLIEPFCIDDVGPLAVTGTITGQIVVPRRSVS